MLISMRGRFGPNTMTQKNSEFVFNSRLADYYRNELVPLASALNSSPDAIRPIEFTTFFSDERGSPIAGVLSQP